MAGVKPFTIKSISEAHRLRGLPKPEHPLISVINEPIRDLPDNLPKNFVTDLYSIVLKRNAGNHFKIRYGQQEYDFDEGVMSFMSPGQVFGIELDPQGNGIDAQQVKTKPAEWVLLVHPDFLWNTTLAQKIRQYEFFNYSVNEALFLSEKEENLITGIFENIRQEYRSSIDKFTQEIIITQLESLLVYAERFYTRQFITRKVTNHRLLNRLEALLTAYFNSEGLLKKGFPTVKFISDELHVSPNYLSGLLKMLTGRSTQEHIQDKIIEIAKEKLSTSDLSISEIAYELGFGYPQSFNKLFKNKTQLTPLQYRQSFN
jgi:AraC family transcriptional activator of pobA